MKSRGFIRDLILVKHLLLQKKKTHLIVLLLHIVPHLDLVFLRNQFNRENKLFLLFSKRDKSFFLILLFL